MLSCFVFVASVAYRDVRDVLTVTYVTVIFCFNAEKGCLFTDLEEIYTAAESSRATLLAPHNVKMFYSAQLL
jgi:hypothetical protein